MMENYVYPDTHEMFDLHDTLEELISKESYDIGLGLGSSCLLYTSDAADEL